MRSETASGLGLLRIDSVASLGTVFSLASIGVSDGFTWGTIGADSNVSIPICTEREMLLLAQGPALAPTFHPSAVFASHSLGGDSAQATFATDALSKSDQAT